MKMYAMSPCFWTVVYPAPITGKHKAPQRSYLGLPQPAVCPCNAVFYNFCGSFIRSSQILLLALAQLYCYVHVIGLNFLILFCVFRWFIFMPATSIQLCCEIEVLNHKLKLNVSISQQPDIEIY